MSGSIAYVSECTGAGRYVVDMKNGSQLYHGKTSKGKRFLFAERNLSESVLDLLHLRSDVLIVSEVKLKPWNGYLR